MRRFSLTRWMPPLALVAVLLPGVGAAADQTGPQLYATKCAKCHGPQGEGTKNRPERLEGDKSLVQLAALIRKTMPEDDAGSLSAGEAQAVAAYIHGAFYSAVARERNRPARIELARLTVRQYRNAVADLIGSFRGPMPPEKSGFSEKPGFCGLRGEYFAGRRLGGRGGRALDRVDPQVNFDFGTDTPLPRKQEESKQESGKREQNKTDKTKIEPHEFSIRWTGSLLAPDTGEYEFLVRTEHAARLWVNELNQPLIDAWVKSGSDTEYRGTLFLVGGRVYPLRLEFTKAKQGVDDSKKQKEKPKPVKASIVLLWKRPHGALEPIPSRHLSPTSAPESLVCAIPFPPDDRSYGWERGTTISKEWDQATTDAAIETAGYLAAHLAELSGARENAADRPQKLRTFCRTLAERAFRRPLTADEAKVLIDKQFDAAKDPDTAVKRVALLALKSPRFLYREIGDPGAHGTAARLSFGLWDSIPDQELLAAASAGRLATKEQVVQQAERMLADRRAKAKLHGFLMNWARAEHGLDLAKDPKRFPGFDAAAIADLRTSLELFLDDVMWSERADFRELLLAEELFLNGRLAKLYGANLPADAGFTKVKLDSGRRAGVLTHPYLMTSFAHSSESSPIHRGVFLARGVLGLSLRPPPEAVTPLPPNLHPTLTTRERVTLQTRSNACMTCHGIINPLGFTLEHFDAVGRFRDQDHGKPIDALGSYRTRAGQTVTLNSARELATFLAGSEEAQAALAEQLFHHLVQQPAQAYGPGTLEGLRRSFVAGGFNLRKLAVEIMALSAMKPRDAKDARGAGG